MELKICHLYSDVMNLSCDRGNLICMEKRLQWRGIDVVTTGVSIGQKLESANYDLFFPQFDRGRAKLHMFLVSKLPFH